jgi:hypothetical protein
MMLREQAGSTFISVVAMCIITGVVAMAQLFRIAAVGTASARDTTLAAIFWARRPGDPIGPAGPGIGHTAAKLRIRVDHLDAFGSVVGDGEECAARSARRWSVRALQGSRRRIVQVLVTRQQRGSRTGQRGRLQDEAGCYAHGRGAMSPTRRFARPNAGFSLVELLVASMIAVVVMGALFSIVTPAQRVKLQPEVADLHTADAGGRGRDEAGAHRGGGRLDWGPAAGPLLDFIAPVLPYARLAMRPIPRVRVFRRMRSRCSQLTGGVTDVAGRSVAPVRQTHDSAPPRTVPAPRPHGCADSRQGTRCSSLTRAAM